jgi:serine/threonine-protein kinase
VSEPRDLTVLTSSADTVVPPATDGAGGTTGLPSDVQAQSARRLGIIALLYAFVFFMSDPLTAVLFPEERARFFGNVVRWAPSTISIGAAIAVAAATFTRRWTRSTVLTFGLWFEVAASFGIAAAQYLDISQYATNPPWAGLSWVAVWMLGFTMMVPGPPRGALTAALASACAVPLTVGFTLLSHPGVVAMSPLRFVLLLVLPYFLVVLIADVGARLVYRLGTELTRARRLGSYQLIERLGSGGMGEVWRAQHRLLARPAAIKLVRPEVLGGSTVERRSELQARFEREAQATALLRSPHTIQIYDFGIAADGAFYYVMELLDGFDVERLIRQFGPVPVERAVHLLLGVCHSLAEAHASRLVHRDIKPANVYVCRYGREVDFVKVLDFGLVKSQGDGMPQDASVTGAFSVAGTPAFMSPEQVAGDRTLDGRSDIYAIGCLAYWLVTGQLVFRGRTVVETIVQHRQETPLPPSQVAELPVPADFDAIVLECLAKTPADRPPTVDDLARRLAAIAFESPWSAGRAREWWDLHHPAQPQGPAGSARPIPL